MAVGWPATARGHMLVRAQGVEDERAVEELAQAFDAGMDEGQRLLALIITLSFKGTSATAHDLLIQGIAFAALRIAPRRLSTLVVLHWPPDVHGWRPPHLHLVIFGRVQNGNGWGEMHPDLAESRRDVGAAEWDAFLQKWHEREL